MEQWQLAPPWQAATIKCYSYINASEIRIQYYIKYLMTNHSQRLFFLMSTLTFGKFKLQWGVVATWGQTSTAHISTVSWPCEVDMVNVLANNFLFTQQTQRNICIHSEFVFLMNGSPILTLCLHQRGYSRAQPSFANCSHRPHRWLLRHNCGY